MSALSLANGLQTLRELVGQEATGELICAADEAEVHVHLQNGRIAWATTSVARFAFARHVAAHCSIDSEALREIVQECRRERKPLGRTLIEWGLATESDVREALRKQICEALSTLPDGAAAAVFLRRGQGYSSYDRELTFELDELLPRVTRTLAPAPVRMLSSVPPSARLGDALRELVQHAEISWAEHHLPERLVERVPHGTARGVEPLASVFDGDTDFVAVRSESETVLGLALSMDRGAVWCGLAPDATLGAVLALVRERLGGLTVGRISNPGAGLGTICTAQDEGLPPSMLRELMERSDGLWGIAMRDPSSQVRWLGWREYLDRGELGERVAGLSGTLATARALPRRDGESGLWQSSMVVSTSPGWFFGASLLDGTGRDLWLVLDPSATQGLGWALLASLLRRTSLTAREVAR